MTFLTGPWALSTCTPNGHCGTGIVNPANGIEVATLHPKRLSKAEKYFF
jgi:hypothetical protein